MKICIVKLSAMGDIIHAMVALEFIKKSIPNIEIDWIVEKSFLALLEHNPNINNILPLELKSIKKDKRNFFREIKKVKQYAKNNYDLVIDAQGLLKSAIVSKLLDGNVVVGFDKDSIREGISSFFYNKKLSIPYDANTIDRNVYVLCEALDIKVSSRDILEKQPFLYFKQNDEIELKDKYNLFVIGSTWESRNYPKEKFVDLANVLEKDTYIVWGSEEEHKKAIWMAQQSKYLEVLPKGNLNTLKSVISKATLVIGNDTGPTHMAWGLNVASITIFGPTPINRVYITPINKVIKSSSKVNHYKLNKQDFSIKEIEVEDNLFRLD